MKISIDVEATPQEFREFLGLPDIGPLQAELLDSIRQNALKGVTGFDAMSLMKPLFPAQIQSMESLQQAFWQAFNQGAGAANAAAKNSTAEPDGSAESTADSGTTGRRAKSRGK